jgi:hypothetical protein
LGTVYCSFHPQELPNRSTSVTSLSLALCWTSGLGFIFAVKNTDLTVSWIHTQQKTTPISSRWYCSVKLQSFWEVLTYYNLFTAGISWGL